jgi:hypothetical protein
MTDPFRVFVEARLPEVAAEKDVGKKENVEMESEAEASGSSGVNPLVEL